MMDSRSSKTTGSQDLPTLDFGSSYSSRALTERNKVDVQFGKGFQPGNFQKMKSQDRSNPEVVRRLKEENKRLALDNQEYINSNRYLEM